MRRITWLALLPCIFPVFTFCDNSDSVIGEDEIEVVIDQFTTLYQNTHNSETFLFFSDPHLLSGENMFTPATRHHLNSSFELAKDLYYSLPISFCLCGGDWLNQRDSQEMAKEKLLYTDRLMKKTFSRYYKMMGNHDTNYLGYVSSRDKQRGDLPREFIDNEYFSDTGSAYYAFDGENTRFYILDSGVDWDMAMDDYRWEQIFWLAGQLETNDTEHIAIGIHIFYHSDIKTPMSELLVKLFDAYNLNQTIIMNGKEFNFETSKGKICFVISGHNHEDRLSYEGKDNKLAVIETCNYDNEGTQAFDLCLVDYEKNLLNMIRVGRGSSRRIELN